MTVKVAAVVRLIQKLAFSIALVCSVSMVSAGSGEENHGEKEGFDASEMIMHHIKDAHDWHVMDIDGHAVSIPLPIIIYHSERGLSVFMSSKFEHGTADYNGYRLDHQKVVAVDESGQVSEELTAGILDLSITKNVAALMISIFFMLWLFIKVAKSFVRNQGKAPSGIQSFIEPLILFVRDDIAKAAIGEKHYMRFMPYLLTIFFFIWINNLLGLVPFFPGGANVTGNIAIPLTLAVITFVITSFSGNRHYWLHVFAMPGVPKPVLLILTPIEFLGIFLKPFVLMVRLFANITAGHIVILVFFSLIFIAGSASTAGGFGTAVPAVAFTIFINGLELVVGFLQAFVFTFLSAVYFGAAVAEPHH